MALKPGDLVRVSQYLTCNGFPDSKIPAGTITRVAMVNNEGSIQPVCQALKIGKIHKDQCYCASRFEPLANVKDDWKDHVKVGDALVALVDSPLGADTVEAASVMVVKEIRNGSVCSSDGCRYWWPIASLEKWFCPVDHWQHPNVEEIKVGDKLRVRAGFDYGRTDPNPPNLRAGEIAVVSDVRPGDRWSVIVEKPEYWSFRKEFLWNVELVKDEPWHQRVKVGMWLKVTGDVRSQGIHRDLLPVGSKVRVVELHSGGFKTTGIDGEKATGAGDMWHWLLPSASKLLEEIVYREDGLENIPQEYEWLRDIKPGDRVWYDDKTCQQHSGEVEFLEIVEEPWKRREIIAGISSEIQNDASKIQIRVRTKGGAVLAGRFVKWFKPMVQRAEQRPTAPTLRELVRQRLAGAIQ
jgi:hypothetical protein